ncbi:MAG TPA: YHS domain-containing (seleno)protein, partial [Verrucomicrobiae bacterium]|nr:YHS domain-containing (seleno)protein [Verrucomicrobiae bacterium]
MKRFLSALLVVVPVALAMAQSKSLLNLDKAGVAIQGYDPVAFFTDNKPVKGKPELAVRHNGATYYFASREHREQFKADPAKYEPVF